MEPTDFVPLNSKPRPYYVGLTGGMGAGKSAVAQNLVELGAHLVDADVVARQLVAPGQVALTRIAQEFGPAVLTASGELDRAALAELIFADPPKRLVVESILHPLIRQRAAELLQQAGPGQIAVYEVPLLVETGMENDFDAIITVEAPLEHRLDRLVQSRGMNTENALARINAQATDEHRRPHATYVINNDTGKTQLKTRIQEVWKMLQTAATAVGQ